MNIDPLLDQVIAVEMLTIHVKNRKFRQQRESRLKYKCKQISEDFSEQREEYLLIVILLFTNHISQ